MAIGRIVRTVVIVAVVGFSVMAPVAGFHLGPHEDIVKAALPAGKTIEATALRQIIDANKAMDLDQGDSAKHFDNAPDAGEICDLWKRGLNEYLNEALINAEPVGTEKRELKNRDKALEAFGRATHAIGDFYSHTNWVELHPPSPGGALLPMPQAPILAQSCDPGAFPRGLYSGYFNLNASNVANGLGCDATAGRRGMECHSTLNKDSSTEPRGRLPYGSGMNHHQAAAAIAQASTEAAWQALGDRIEARYGTVTTDGKCAFAKLAWGGDRSCHRKWGATGEIKTHQEYKIGDDGILYHELNMDRLTLSFELGSEDYPGPSAPPVYADVRGTTHQRGTFCQWAVVKGYATPKTCMPYTEDTIGSDDAVIKVTPNSEPIELDWRVTFPGKKPDCGWALIVRIDPGAPPKQPFRNCEGPAPIPNPILPAFTYTGTFSVHPE